MRVRCSSEAQELAAFMRRCACAVEPVAPDVLDVIPDQVEQPELARLQVEGLLRVWKAAHQGAESEVVLLGGTSEEEGSKARLELLVAEDNRRDLPGHRQQLSSLPNQPYERPDPKDAA